MDGKQYDYTGTEFGKELEALINKHSLENQSNTPDFLLSLYLENCLANWNAITTQRDRWYRNNPVLLSPDLGEVSDGLLGNNSSDSDTIPI